METHFLYDPETERRIELLRDIQDRIDSVPSGETIIFKKFLIGAILATKPKRAKPLKLNKEMRILNRKPLSVKKSMRLVGEKKDHFPNLSGKLFDKILSYAQNPRVDRVFCNGPGHDIVVDFDGKKFESGMVFRDFKEMNEFILKLVKSNNAEFKPAVDLMMPGFRVQAIFGSEAVVPKFIMKRV